MPRYRFTARAIYQSGPPESWPRYEEGETYLLDRDHGDRWVRRGVAALVEGDGPALHDPRYPMPADTMMASDTVRVLYDAAETIIAAHGADTIGADSGGGADSVPADSTAGADTVAADSLAGADTAMGATARRSRTRA